MVKQREKYLKKIENKRQKEILVILEKINKLDFNWLDIKRIIWESNLFRCKTKDLRILFEIKNEQTFIKKILPRWDIYKNI